MPEFVCQACGAAFSLPVEVLDRFPGWTPKRCRACRDGTRSDNGSDGAVEENLTLAQVLDRYDRGPSDGVFTDGSADPNPGPGGWGAVYVVDGEVVDQTYGHEAHTTNNRMELTALIAGYDLVPPGTPATVYSDSRLCVDTITKWAPEWERRGWRRKTGPVHNLDLVRPLYERAKARPEVRLAWIQAHAGSRWNEYADSLSTAYRRSNL
ncbi:MAG: ribonuclease HI [Actinomycetota bacterium]|nr:ribonuclease HI [Actinomycetota bacterium]